MNYADIVLIGLLLAAGVSGYRKGLVTAALSLAGAIGGALLGLKLAPFPASGVTEQIAKVGISGALVVIAIIGGQAIGTWLGSMLVRRLTWRPILAVDRSLGMVGQMLGALAVAWLVAVPLASVPVPWLSAQLRTSAVLGTVNRAVPEEAAAVSATLRGMLAGTDFPPILAPLAPAPNVPVPVPDEGLAADPVLRTAAQSILKIRAEAPACSVLMTGSGFVVSPGTVVTNAHVIAGADTVNVETSTGVLSATVVQYNPSVDLAVLKVDGLTAPSLTITSQPAASGDDAVAAGYPLDGPYTVSPVRVRDEMVLRGPNIYGTATVARDVYALRGSVRPGNSGGPLLAPNGTVIGVIFGAAIDDPEVGFALTVRQSQPTIAAGIRSNSAVPTGSCATR